ncbi:hypothetical protein [Candidatus Nitrosocosmicus sp. SS]|uniref:hypothetical protein n=1 Tax=Candidatus Nitrosocosmicus agrestis TaxID=2563600 RepID=UPI0018A8746E|nr:hypothetical protein [Candidatus Nitrosocosmicus sp. SS]
MESYGTISLRSSISTTTNNNLNNSSSSGNNSPLPLNNISNLSTQSLPNQDTQSDFDVQQGLPLSRTIGIYDLPKNIVLTDDNGKNNKIPIRAFFSEGLITQLEKPSVNKQVKFKLDDWNQNMIFSLQDFSGLNIVNIKNILVGQIKSYDSVEDALEDATYWKNIPLNEEIMLRFENKGLNFIILEVTFQNGISGIYHAIFNLDAYGSESDADDLLDYRMDKENANYNIIDDSKPKIEVNNPFWQISQIIVCEDLKYNGFRVCG